MMSYLAAQKLYDMLPMYRLITPLYLQTLSRAVKVLWMKCFHIWISSSTTTANGRLRRLTLSQPSSIDSVREMWKEFKSLAPVEADVCEIDEFQRWKQQIYQHGSDQDEFERFVNASHCVTFLLLYIHGLIFFFNIKIKAGPVPIGDSSASRGGFKSHSKLVSHPYRI
jgi:hypothetical protein